MPYSFLSTFFWYSPKFHYWSLYFWLLANINNLENALQQSILPPVFTVFIIFNIFLFKVLLLASSLSGIWHSSLRALLFLGTVSKRIFIPFFASKFNLCQNHVSTWFFLFNLFLSKIGIYIFDITLVMASYHKWPTRSKSVTINDGSWLH